MFQELRVKSEIDFAVAVLAHCYYCTSAIYFQRFAYIFLHIRAVHPDIIKVYLPTDAHLNCLKDNFKIYIKIDITTTPTCFGVITIIRERTVRSCQSHTY